MTDQPFIVKNGLIVNTNVFIVDTGQNAAIVPNILYIGNTSVNVSINSTFFTGTANAACTISGIASANIVSNAQLQSNLLNFQTLAGEAANVAVITALQLQTLVQNNAGGNVTTWTPTNVTSTMAQLTLTSNTKMGVPSGFANGTYILFVLQANGGNNQITWFSNNWFWPAGVQPTLSTANGALDIVSVIYNSAVNNAGNVTLYGTYAPNFLHG